MNGFLTNILETTTVKLDYARDQQNTYIRHKRKGLRSKVFNWDQNISFHLFVTPRFRYTCNHHHYSRA